MMWMKQNQVSQFYSYIVNCYTEFTKESKRYNFKIIDIKLDEKSNEILLFVLINGIKKQVITYFPRDLVNNNNILAEFSPLDARAITFYALQQEKYSNLYSANCIICGQELDKGETVFLYTIIGREKLQKKRAIDLYRETALLCQFNQFDLINIVSTAIQEQTIRDFSVD